MKREMSEYVLYRWRYFISSILAVVIVSGLFVYGAFFVPDGLRDAEEAAAITSGSLSYNDFDPESVINLPYHVLQRAGFALFDVSILTIKIPSLIFGVLAVIGIFYLIREWFRPNIAIVTGLIAVTIPAMIFAAQDATPTIFVIATSVWLLLAATRVTRMQSPVLFWKVLCFVLFGLNLYAPLGIYLNLAIVSTMLFHPHIRMVMRRLNINYVAASIALTIIVLSPLLYGVTTKPHVGLELLGFVDDIPDMRQNLITLGETLFGAYGPRLPLVPPIMSIGLLGLVVIGISRFIMVRHTARSYITWFWALTLLPLVILNPQYASYLLPLIILMIAMGIAALIAEWYKMFPRNPYARVFGLFPLGMIVLGLSLTGISRYTTSFQYTPSIASQFDSDIRLLDIVIESADVVSDRKIDIIVARQDKQFYELLARYNEDFNVASSPRDIPTPFIASGAYLQKNQVDAIPTKIFTNSMSRDADRFYLYTEVKK